MSATGIYLQRCRGFVSAAGAEIKSLLTLPLKVTEDYLIIKKDCNDSPSVPAPKNLYASGARNPEQ